jgi:hypothetical protein
MRHYRDVIFGCLVLLMAAPAVIAQTPPAPPLAAAPALVPPPNWAFADLACAPYLTKTPLPSSTLRILGSQDTVIKEMMSHGDTILVSGGSNAGLKAGDRFYVRRLVRTFGAMKGPDDGHPLTVHTAGWIQILGVDSTLATATVVQACDGILLDDFLEPFVAPMVPAQAMPGNMPVYDNMGHMLTGVEASQVFSVGQMANIDRGTKAGVVPGMRFLVFRDKRDLPKTTDRKSAVFAQLTASLPLTEIGQVMVVAVREDDSTVQILAQKDAIQTGDLIAEIR